jgi:hypothetical protein
LVTQRQGPDRRWQAVDLRSPSLYRNFERRGGAMGARVGQKLSIPRTHVGNGGSNTARWEASVEASPGRQVVNLVRCIVLEGSPARSGPAVGN